MTKSISESLLLPTELSLHKALNTYYHRFQLFMMVVGANLLIGLLLIFAVTNWYVFWAYIILLATVAALLILRIAKDSRTPTASVTIIENDQVTEFKIEKADDLERLISLIDQITIIRQELEGLKSSQQVTAKQEEFETLRYEINQLTDCLAAF